MKIEKLRKWAYAHGYEMGEFGSKGIKIALVATDVDEALKQVVKEELLSVFKNTDTVILSSETTTTCELCSKIFWRKEISSLYGAFCEKCKEELI